MKLQGNTCTYSRRIYHTLSKRSLLHLQIFKIKHLYCVLFALICVFFLVPTTIACAQKYLFKRNVTLGSLLKPIEISVTTDQASDVTLSAGNTNVRLPLQMASSAELTIEKVTPNRFVAIVKVTGIRGKAAAIVGQKKGHTPKVLWIGRLDFQGDIGERYRDVIEFRKTSTGKYSEIVVGQYFEGNQVCGKADTILNPQSIDPQTLRLVSISYDPLAGLSPSVSQTITATRISPGAQSPPLLRNMLRFTAASSRFGYSGPPINLLPPNVLIDGDLSTAWMENRGSGGKGEFITAQWGATSWPIRAIALVLSPANKEKSEQVARPKSLWLVGDDQVLLKVTIPEDPITYPGERYWVIPETPLSWHCLSVILDQAYFPPTNRKAHTAIAEIEVYSDLDFGGGIDTLVKHLSQGDRLAHNAIQILLSIGPASIPPLIDSWDQMGPVARRRAIRIFAASAKSSQTARKALVAAAQESHQPVSEDAIKALINSGEEAFDELATLLSGRTNQADKAALAIAKLNPTRSIPLLLVEVSKPGGTERPKLREAITKATKTSVNIGFDYLLSWAQQETDVSTLVTVVYAISPIPQAHQLSLSMLLPLLPKINDFKDRWRSILASKYLPLNKKLDDWLAEIAQNDRHWMLREAALKSMAERGEVSALPYIRKALADDYPRVRVTGLSLLDKTSKTIDLLSEIVVKDEWPMVRAAAITDLATYPASQQILIQAVEDRAKIVRSTAIRSLIAQGDRSAWKYVKDRLLDDQEWPQVTNQAILFAKTLCIEDAAVALEGVIERGLMPHPWLPDVETAANALDALVVLSGEKARPIVKRASLPFAPPALRAMAETIFHHAKKCKVK